MLDRRRLMIGIAGAALAPPLSWAAVGNPSHLAAARNAAGDWVLAGLRPDGTRAFQVALPGRAHAGAAHPHRAEAVVFARRPGRFALAIDCATGAVCQRLAAPGGRHFSGHGAISPDGRRLWTGEVIDATSEGRIGIWAAAASGWRRAGELASGGIGPHEVLLLPGGHRLAVANGGLVVDPADGRRALNAATMRPNLALIGVASGRIEALIEAQSELRQNSIRHLAAAPDGGLALACQWAGDPAEAPPLLGLVRPGAEAIDWPDPGAAIRRRARGYAGSVALDRDGRVAAVSAPRGGFAWLTDAAGRLVGTVAATDLSGLAAAGDGLLASDGLGRLWTLRTGPTGAKARLLAQAPLAWDNHLIALGT